MDNNIFKCFSCQHRLTMGSCFNPEKCQRMTNGIISKVSSVIHTEILVKKVGRKVKQNLPDVNLTVIDNVPWDIKETPFTVYG